MESAVPDQPQSRISLFFRSLGPGILMASAAVGGSHLVASTKAGVAIAFGNPVEPVANFESPSPWSIAAIGFIVVTMGWMPAPIEISCLTSAWLKRQSSQQEVTPRSALFDFNVGYIGTAVLALVFVSLGALMLHGSGIELKSSGVGFSHQLVGLYASTIGEWSRYLIAVIAFFCIFGSTITVIDGYSRVIADSQRLLRSQAETDPKATSAIMLAVSLLALGICGTQTEMAIDCWAHLLVWLLSFVYLVEVVDVIRRQTADKEKGLRLKTFFNAFYAISCGSPRSDGASRAALELD